jgi:hypothetical protein
MDEEELRQVSLSFRRHTGVSLDGIHVRHMAMLPPAARVVLALLFQVVEQLGCLPHQVQRLLIFLIHKATGGRRPIMLAPAFYRWWTRARRPVAQAWEDANDQPFFSAGKGRSAVDLVWRRAVAAEVDAASRRSSITGLWDVAKFFERVIHALLVRRGIRCGAPMRLLRVCIRMYRSPRYLAIKPFVARPLWATVGVAAGCGFATTWIKVYTLQPFLDAMVSIASALPRSVRWHADIFIDDLQMDVAADSDDAALSALDEVASNFLCMITDEMHADLACSKASIVASSVSERGSDALAKRARRILGHAGGKCVVAAPSLGIDFAEGELGSHQSHAQEGAAGQGSHEGQACCHPQGQLAWPQGPRQTPFLGQRQGGCLLWQRSPRS